MPGYVSHLGLGLGYEGEGLGWADLKKIET